MYSKKAIKRLEKQFQRDNDLGVPFHKSDAIPQQRVEFMQQLFNTPDFVRTIKKNDKKFNKPFNLKRFSAFDYCIIALFTTISGCLAYGYTYSKTPSQYEQEISKLDFRLLMTTLLGLFTGFVVGCMISEINIEESRESSIDSFYTRLSVRIFDAMRETFPDLDESILKACNPEMARVITAIMIANMPESDTREIRDIALKFADQLRELTPKNKEIVLRNCDKDIKTALSIIEQNFVLNPQLQNTILGVYRGKIPAVFNLQEKTR